MDDIRKLDGVIIDPGHGGVDSGARGSDLLEKEYNLLISRYMYDRFRELGVPVYITRDSDTTLEPTDRIKKIMSFYGNDPNVVLVSNHLNAGGGTGAEVIYALRNNSKLANSILNNIGNTGQSTRRVYQRRLPSDPTKDYYYILRNTGNIEPLIVEYGFIDNDKDLYFSIHSADLYIKGKKANNKWNLEVKLHDRYDYSKPKNLIKYYKWLY